MHHSLPLDPTSAAAIADAGLRYALVDPGDEAGGVAWVRADVRGFHADDVDHKDAVDNLRAFTDRRMTGVYDDTAASPEIPVATVSSWVTSLTTPGTPEQTQTMDAWAISSVTVSPTHRRRGIARALLEGELRTAVAGGLPLAALTVSEATIYRRFGFACAVLVADWSIDTRRAKWTGPAARGRVQFVERAALRAQADDIERRARRSIPGEVDRWGRRWDEFFGLTPDTEKESKGLRAVRYDDENGEPQGFALFKLKEHESDFSAHTVVVTEFVAVTDDAYAGLWRFLLELDLVTEVRASLRSVDEPLRWMVADARAVRKTAESDHLWLRVLDVPATLTSRRYAAPGSIAFDVRDALGFAAGRFVLSTDASGAAACTASDAPADAEVSLDIAELGALFLGGISAATLRAAGRLTATPDAAAAIDRLFLSPTPPRLGIWF
ncbi:putative acetyltransferase [Microbacteriaceae bacterium SG_E_30_P1]|uniref:Acetyltransferase n=1 Tax=Antiquaquibacter oligotrophicus TaxID=2880260 RepID=A0ABT6KJ90_9MICO|nr:GNAT family N-acetyltransferase [Antiquaquibacter oligotrophicus]MDH6180048.1 putative acetyltransferase [Antiquaquibacter oligotrophicus]UDF14199.1 GNAT family N-acetyltransferase [Antiquaquibacter oligotrophicus]